MPNKAGAAPSVVGPIAKTLGVSTVAVQYHLKKEGYSGPYTDMERALKIMESRPQFAKKIKRFRDTGGVAKGANGAAVTAPRKKKERKKPLRTAAVERERLKKFKDHFAHTLIRRLGAHLQKLTRGLSDKAAKQRAVKILRKGNYHGPRWDDEARAVQIFIETGIDMSKFESANEIPLGNGHALIPRAQPGQAVVLRNGAQPLDTTPVVGEAERWGLEALRRVKTSLEQWEYNHFSRAQKRLKNRFEPGDEMIVDALITSRTPPSRR